MHVQQFSMGIWPGRGLKTAAALIFSALVLVTVALRG
jgi:hypothetical protein